jgi:hypothetical protein
MGPGPKELFFPTAEASRWEEAMKEKKVHTVVRHYRHFDGEAEEGARVGNGQFRRTMRRRA